MNEEGKLRDRTVGEIAATLPGATTVFRKYKLDFCCGGDVSLTQATLDRGVDLAAVEGDLATLGRGRASLLPEATDALIGHIVQQYHEVHRHELPELIRLARKVETVHANHPEAPHGLAHMLDITWRELDLHMQSEEAELFPLMRQPLATLDQEAIRQMRDDHNRHGDYLRSVETIVKDFVLPEGACRSWQALYVGTSRFVDDLMEHIHVENNVLFPRFEQTHAM